MNEHFEAMNDSSQDDQVPALFFNILAIMVIWDGYAWVVLLRTFEEQ